MPNSSVTLYFLNEFDMLRVFIYRVPYHQREWWPDDIVDNIKALELFMDMTRRMSDKEIQIYFEEWLDMFGKILGRYFRGETWWEMDALRLNLLELLVIIEEVFPAEISSKTDLFLKECAKGLEETELVYDCESGTWSVIISRLLRMDKFKLHTKRLGSTLIRYGYQYGYDQKYYKHLCYELFKVCWEVKGMPFRGNNFSKSILDSGNLRMQLGIELLLTVLPDTENDLSYFCNPVYKRILRCMWRATPFPFITGEELFNMLKPHYHYEGGGPSLQDVCDAYVECNTIFEVPVKTQPRSLEDLSKIQIRKTLYEAKGINDEAIDSLQLPRTLHNYLKLGED